MTERPRSDRRTQNRVVARFTVPALPDSLRYRYFGDLSKRENNRAIETAILKTNLGSRVIRWDARVTKAGLLRSSTYRVSPRLPGI